MKKLMLILILTFIALPQLEPKEPNKKKKGRASQQVQQPFIGDCFTTFDTTITPVVEVLTLVMTANGAGPIDSTVGFQVTTPPAGINAYSADWYQDVLGGGNITSLPTGMQEGFGWFFVVAGGNTIVDHISALGRWTRNGNNNARLAGNSYELRFNYEPDNRASDFFNTGNPMDVPFETWYLGPDPDDPSDDVRMIPLILEEVADQTFAFQLDHQASGGNNDPFSDWIYFVMPSYDPSPGESGYQAFLADSSLATGLSLIDDEHIGKMVLMNFNQRQGESFPGAFDGPEGAMPDTGTVFRLSFGAAGFDTTIVQNNFNGKGKAYGRKSGNVLKRLSH